MREVGKKLSLVIPVYNEVAILQQILDKYIFELKSLNRPYEIIAIDDGSTDGSHEVLIENAKKCRTFKVITLDGRYGKQAAITAGFEHIHPESQTAIIADIDLSNPQGILTQVLSHIDDGEKIVYAKRQNFGFDRVKALTSDLFVSFATKFFAVDGFYTGKSNITAYDRAVIDVIRALPGKNKFLRTMDNWIGWEIFFIEYPSSYNKKEAKQVEKCCNKKVKDIPTKRDKIREHTNSVEMMYGFMVGALAMLLFGIIFSIALGGELWAHLAIWLVFAFLVLSGCVYYARAVLIKRVGIIHRDPEVAIYEIKETHNVK